MKIQGKLGQGGEGTVYKVLNNQDKKDYALKYISCPLELKEKYEKEFYIYTRGLDCVVEAYECYFDEKESAFIYTLKLCETNLLNFMSQNKNLNYTVYAQIFIDILTG